MGITKEAKNLRERLNQIRLISPEEKEEAGKILDERYNECDSQGHRNLRNGYCNHCYRHTSYCSPETDEYVAVRNKDLFDMEIPVDLPAIEDMERREIDFAKSQDRFEGIRKIVLES